MIKAVFCFFFPSAFLSIMFLDNVLLHVIKANEVMNCFHFLQRIFLSISSEVSLELAIRIILQILISFTIYSFIRYCPM